MRPSDFRSDTVTRPTPAMREAIACAEVGDDVFGDDPTVHALQARAAALTGMQAALFLPSGTMGNQVALLAHCRPGDDVLVGEGAHVMLYESGGAAALAGVQFTVLGGGGHFTAEAVREAISAPDPSGHRPPTRLVTVENTHNRGGGRVMSPATFASVAHAAHAAGVAVHIDGARLFNAAVAAGVGVDAWTRHADSVTFCLSKGLGAPVGSVLCGDAAFVARAHRYRKMLGGGLRQAGVLAAAGLYALDHHVDRLGLDHARARRLAEAVAGLPGVELDPASVETNIVIVRLSADAPAPTAVCKALAPDVLAVPFGPRGVRFVTHLDVDDADVDRAIAALTRVLAGR